MFFADVFTLCPQLLSTHFAEKQMKSLESSTNSHTLLTDKILFTVSVETFLVDFELLSAVYCAFLFILLNFDHPVASKVGSVESGPVEVL